MRKLSQKATKKLTKGNPMPVKPKEPKSSKKKINVHVNNYNST